MNRLLISIMIVIFISSSSFAELKLKLPMKFSDSNSELITANNLSLKVEVPPSVTNPASMKDLVKGAILLGLLADVSIPLGDENEGFKHIAGTGFSGHISAAYLLSASFMIALRAGYINFGTKTTEGSDQGFDYKYEDTYSIIPILLGAYYLFETGSSIRPYIGAALGVFFQNYAVKWEESGAFGYEFSLDESFSSTAFGVSPGIGLYLLLGSVMLHVIAEYTYLFSGSPEITYDDNYTLSKINGTAGIMNGEHEEHEKPSFISINLGVSFPLGGN